MYIKCREKKRTKMFVFKIILAIILLLIVLVNLVKACYLDSSKETASAVNIIEESVIKENNIEEKINIIEDDVIEIPITNENNINDKNNTEQENINEKDNKVENEDKTENLYEKEEIEEKPVDESKNNGYRNFGSDVAFIGDSRTQAFLMYAGLNNATNYTNIGLMVDTAITKKFITNKQGQKITILDDLKNRDINTVYIMLGVNELGWVYSSIFIKDYEELVDSIKAIKPNCEIILQSIIPVTKTKSDNDDIYNNARISEYNELIKEMAQRKGIKYIDLVPNLTDANGNLPEGASPDGVHLNKEYCLKWLECLKNN